MKGWHAYYADGSRYSSADASWNDLPEDGLLGVVVFGEPPYRRIVDGADWIWLQDGEIRSVTTAGEWGTWAEPPEVDCASCLKRCVGLPDDEWARVHAEMLADRGL